MITTAATLLEQVLNREQRVLDKVKIKHPPTIGNMYEGLTRTTLDMAIPREANLRITHGFVRDQDGETSKQIDCMLVVGHGEPIPYADGEICDVDSVLAVIEVKKNLYSTHLSEGYDNLLSVMHLTNAKIPDHINESVQRRFQAFTRRPLADEIEAMPPQHQLLYHLLVVEMARPVRVLLGYHGFKSERTFRKGVLDYIDTIVRKPGYGPMSLPHLIMNRNFAVGKANGMPWVNAWDDAGNWSILSSTGGRPMAQLLLEVLWGRLNDRGIVSSSVFGDDRTVEAWNRLVDTRFQPEPRPGGWIYNTWNADPVQPASIADDRAWEPHRVTQEQVTTLIFMGRRGSLQPDVDIPEGERNAVLAALHGLRGMGLVGESFESPGMWVHLTDRCDVVLTPDGEQYAAENNTGRLTRWVDERARRRQ